jgi:hypothetical protein
VLVVVVVVVTVVVVFVMGAALKTALALWGGGKFCTSGGTTGGTEGGGDTGGGGEVVTGTGSTVTVKVVDSVALSERPSSGAVSVTMAFTVSVYVPVTEVGAMIERRALRDAFQHEQHRFGTVGIHECRCADRERNRRVLIRRDINRRREDVIRDRHERQLRDPAKRVRRGVRGRQGSRQLRGRTVVARPL